MTAPASPTECEGCHWDLCPQGGERHHQCLRHNAKDARIRELAAQVQETPTECEACGQDSDFQRRQAIKICDVESENRQLKFDLESAQSINERKDARIRELQATVQSAIRIYRQVESERRPNGKGLSPFFFGQRLRRLIREWVELSEAALARSSEVPK